MSPALAGGFLITGPPRKSEFSLAPESILGIVNSCWRTFNISHIMSHFILGQLCCFIKCCTLFLMHTSPTSATLATRTPGDYIYEKTLNYSFLHSFHKHFVLVRAGCL
ncbi:unnamed protein product [Rangifer tarandus platyrhynchus]|uniref:Uncharacterized protein n=2 Tax=Rangifer tarandus platyrhynchus TaxID=3082113 RepID=A0ABN9A6A7_RANTA|nr:unnamed protein product [Rangifer tarandus platyrhynchus]